MTISTALDCRKIILIGLIGVNDYPHGQYGIVAKAIHPDHMNCLTRNACA